MLKRFAVIALFLAAMAPATSFALPTMTLGGGPVTEGDGLVPLVMFMTNDFGLELFGSSGGLTNTGTLFTAFSGAPCDFAGSCTGSFNSSTGIGFTADNGAGSNIAIGTHRFGTITINAALGTVGQQIVLTLGSYTTAGFASGFIPDATLLTILPIPEPTTVVLLGGALAGLAFLRRRSA